MNRNRYLIVFDYETDWSPDKIDALGIVQIAAVPVDLRNLDILSDEIFNIDVRPDDIEAEGYTEAHASTIDWHSKQQNVSSEEVLNRWRAGVPEKDAWEEFYKYVKGYSKGGKFDQAPIAGGQNIRGFDLPITERFNLKHSKRIPFAKREVFDLMDMSSVWFMFSSDRPKSISLDSLRDFFGISKIGAHDAKKDVVDCALLIKKFLTIYEKIAPRLAWRPEVPQNV